MKISILILLLALGSACSSDPEIIPEVPVKKEAVFIPDSNGIFVNENDMAKLRYQEQLKAYSIGRLEDSVDSSIMHDSHLIYRVESDSAWNLQPGLDIQMPFQAPLASSTPDNPELLKAEIEVKANEQRAIYKYLKEASDKASSQIDALEESVQISKKLLNQNNGLKNSLSQKAQENKQLKHAVAELKKQLQALLKYQQKKEEINIRSKYRR